MAEYIDREAAIALITSRYECPEICAAEIKAIPAADVEPVKHGKWDDSFDGITPYCTICGKTHNCMKRTPPFCPNCGARMDGDTHE